MRLFLDTNILIDLLDSERPHHEASTELMRAVQRGQVRACISAISIVNAIYVLRKAMPGKVMARHLLRMLDTVELSRLDVQDMRAALASDWPIWRMRSSTVPRWHQARWMPSFRMMPT